SNGYKAYTSYNGSDGLKSAEENPVDLIILDLMLPDMDGLEVCKALKRKDETASIPIIMLTAKSSEFDKILGLELGADDYVTKPFSVRELMARVKVILRRSFQDNVESKTISIGDLKIDLAKYQVSKNGKKLGLTLKEFELLRLMSSNRGKVFTREMLLESIWGYDYCGDTRTVDVHIRHLRQKIEDDDNNPKYIETIRGIGYRFSDTCK
ncbi:MAG TPA: DNA-binding response regulator, partial [Clostridiaceae bacterium]|nr:DNA-binding response regulator [Clostridiaceae bacterium]